MMKEAIKVYVEKAEDGTYWGSTQNIPGGVSAYGDTLEDLKINLKQAYEDYLEVAKEFNEDWLEEVQNLKEFERI